jgi:hypothetical protein
MTYLEQHFCRGVYIRKGERHINANAKKQKICKLNFFPPSSLGGFMCGGEFNKELHVVELVVLMERD